MKIVERSVVLGVAGRRQKREEEAGREGMPRLVKKDPIAIAINIHIYIY